MSTSSGLQVTVRALVAGTQGVLGAVNRLGPLPWPLSDACDRLLQAWRGQPANVAAAQGAR